MTRSVSRILDTKKCHGKYTWAHAAPMTKSSSVPTNFYCSSNIFKVLKTPKITASHQYLFEDRNFWDMDQSIHPTNDHSFVKKAVIPPKWISWQQATTEKKKLLLSNSSYGAQKNKTQVNTVGLGLVVGWFEGFFFKFETQKLRLVKKFLRILKYCIWKDIYTGVP